MSFEKMEQALRQRLEWLGPGPPAELLHFLMLPDLEGGRPPDERNRLA